VRPAGTALSTALPRYLLTRKRSQGSIPVAPTIVLLSRAFIDSSVPVMPWAGGGAGTSGGEHFPVHQGVLSAQTSIQRPRRHLVGTCEAKTDAVQGLASRTQGVWRNWPGGVAGADPGASEMAEGSLPHQGICSQRWVVFGPRRPVALRTEPTHHCGSANDRGNAHPGLRVRGNRPAD
jgi:hypothetical protein